MKSVIRLVIVTAGLFLAFASTAAAQCSTQADVGGTAYQVQSVTTTENSRGVYTLEVDVMSYICTFRNGYFRWAAHYPLESVTRRAVDGTYYTVNVLKAESLITSVDYVLIQSQPVTNDQVQTYTFKLDVNEVFAKSKVVRVKFLQRFSVEINHGGKIFKPTPTTGGEVFIDLYR